MPAWLGEASVSSGCADVCDRVMATDSEVTSKATPVASRPPGLSTVYVPLHHRHHEEANVLFGTVGNPRASLPACSSVEYLNFHHKVMKVNALFRLSCEAVPLLTKSDRSI